MRKDFKSQTWVVPQLVLIIGTYDENGNPNAMNAAWGGVYDYNEIFVSLAEHKTTENLRKTGAFTISFATKDTVIPSDFVGIVSGLNDPNKMKKSGLTAIKSAKINAPLFKEYPLTLECEVKSFKDGTLIGKIINVSVDESILTDGKVDYSKFNPIVFDGINNTYRVVGEEVAKAFKVGLNLK